MKDEKPDWSLPLGLHQCDEEWMTELALQQEGSSRKWQEDMMAVNLPLRGKRASGERIKLDVRPVGEIYVLIYDVTGNPSQSHTTTFHCGLHRPDVQSCLSGGPQRSFWLRHKMRCRFSKSHITHQHIHITILTFYRGLIKIHDVGGISPVLSSCFTADNLQCGCTFILFFKD